MKTPTQITDAFESAASSLGSDLSAYWPSTGDNDIPEATPLLHLAAALKSSGWRIYSQLQFEGSRGKHLDLFAFEPQTGIGLAVEGKKFFKKTRAGVADDWERLHRFRLSVSHTPLPALQRSFVAVFGTTFSLEEVSSWWGDSPFAGADVLTSTLPYTVPGWSPHNLVLVVEEISSHFR